MENRGRGGLSRVCLAINLGFLVWLIFMPTASQAELLVENKQRKKALKEIYECYKKHFPEVPTVSPEEAMKLLQSGQAVFVDVRPAEERRVSMLPGSISKNEFLSCAESYRGQTIIVYDTVGLRSGLLAEKLRKKNIGVANLEEGLLGWLHAGGKIYDCACRETHRVHIYGCIWNFAPIDYESIR